MEPSDNENTQDGAETKRGGKHRFVYAETEDGERIPLGGADVARLFSRYTNPLASLGGWVGVAMICVATALGAVAIQGLLDAFVINTGRADGMLDRVTLLAAFAVATLTAFTVAWQRNLVHQADTTRDEIEELIAEIDAELQLHPGK